MKELFIAANGCMVSTWYLLLWATGHSLEMFYLAQKYFCLL